MVRTVVYAILLHSLQHGDVRYVSFNVVLLYTQRYCTKSTAESKEGAEDIEFQLLLSALILKLATTMCSLV